MTGALIMAQTGHRREGAEEQELFVPMFHVAGSTVIKRQIRTLKKAGITRIAVVTITGYEVLERHLAHLAVELYPCERNLFSEGLEHLSDCDELLVVPGDLPLFLSGTLEQLLQASGEVCIPVWEGRDGGPILLRGETLRIVRSTVRAGQTAGERGTIRTDRIGSTAREDNVTYWQRMHTEAPLLQAADCTRISVGDEGVVLALTDSEDCHFLEECARAQKAANELEFQVKLMLRKEDDFFGPGVAAFLLKIQETGSILAACQEMNMSYSKGWKMLARAEEEMGFPFLIRKNGGRGGGFSQLTPEGETFVRKYNAFVQDVSRMAENFFERYYGDYL